jgi:hypothetical protein
MKQALCHSVPFALMTVTVKFATLNYRMSGKADLVIMALAKVQRIYKIVSRGVGVMDDSAKVTCLILCSNLLFFRLIFLVQFVFGMLKNYT